LQVLQARGCLAEVEGAWRPTVAGLLLFGNDPQAFLLRSFITVVRFRGPNTAQGYYDRRDFQGTLPEMVENAEAYLWEHIQHGGRVRGLRREELHEYPRPALRECLINAVAHRDYRLSGARILVSVFADRIEFNSPGGLPGPVTVENILEQQYSRNPRIVRVLFEMGYIEEIGTGLDNVFHWLAEAGQPAPALRDTGGSFLITLYGRDLEKALAEGKPAVLDRTALELNERQRRALVFLQERGRITNREYRELGQVGHEIAHRELSELTSQGVIEKRGAGRGTHYRLVGNGVDD
jgi:ATP-dependent DNA helicase RecG